jgi:hypothetical protein
MILIFKMMMIIELKNNKILIKIYKINSKLIQLCRIYMRFIDFELLSKIS